MKFSIIIPVYNVSKYISKCLNSILNQTYSNYEIILVNDGSTDSSEEVIKSFKDNKIRYYKQKNKGAGGARNTALSKVTGDYIMFIDSDDYIEKDLLKILNDTLVIKEVDILNFNCNIVDQKYNIISTTNNKLYLNLNSIDAIPLLLKNTYIDTLWSYTYKTSFFKKYNFTFEERCINEDFAILVKIFSHAKTFSSISYSGYNYVQIDTSVMHEKDYNKIKKNVEIFYNHYKNHKKYLKNNKVGKLLLSYSAESTIYKGGELKDNDLKEYIKLIKKDKVLDDLYVSSFRKFLKKTYLRIFLKKYYKKIRR